MGRLQAEEMRRFGGDDVALEWHLSHNHYPPVPLSMVAPCKAAIEAFEDEDYHREIALPTGVSYRGKTTAPASAIVEQHHLNSFIGTIDGEDEDR